MEMWKCHTGQTQLPVPDEDSLVFWEACRRQRLVVQQCVACQHYRFPPSRLWQTGVQMLSPLRCDDPSAISIGLPVRVMFEPANERVTLPKFVPATTLQMERDA